MRSCVPMAEAVGWIAHQLGWQAHICTLAVPQIFRGTDGGRTSCKLLILFILWWAHKGSNLGPLPCEGRAAR